MNVSGRHLRAPAGPAQTGERERAPLSMCMDDLGVAGTSLAWRS
jgi:hypothetical protein